MRTVSLVDMILTILLPFFVILVVNMSISLKLMQFSKILFDRSTTRPELCRLRTHSGGSNYLGGRIGGGGGVGRAASINGGGGGGGGCSSRQVLVSRYAINPPPKSTTTSELVAATTNSIGSTSQINLYMFLADSSHLKRSKSYSRTTRILILISLTYILLNSLMVYSKLRLLLVNGDFDDTAAEQMLGFDDSSAAASAFARNKTSPLVTVGDPTMSNELNEFNVVDQTTNELVERVACYLYYLNFSINFFLYVLNKSKFRDIFCNIFKRRDFRSTSR